MCVCEISIGFITFSAACFSMMDPCFHWHVSLSLSLFLSFFLAVDGVMSSWARSPVLQQRCVPYWHTVTVPHSARPVLISALFHHLCVCVWAFNCGWWLQVSTDESARTQLLSLFRVLFSRSVRLSSGFTHHLSCHSRTGCPFRLDTIIHLCVCVCV